MKKDGRIRTHAWMYRLGGAENYTSGTIDRVPGNFEEIRRTAGRDQANAPK